MISSDDNTGLPRPIPLICCPPRIQGSQPVSFDRFRGFRWAHARENHQGMCGEHKPSQGLRTCIPADPQKWIKISRRKSHPLSHLRGAQTQLENNRPTNSLSSLRPLPSPLATAVLPPWGLYLGTRTACTVVFIIVIASGHCCAPGTQFTMPCPGWRAGPVLQVALPLSPSPGKMIQATHPKNPIPP